MASTSAAVHILAIDSWKPCEFREKVDVVMVLNQMLFCIGIHLLPVESDECNWGRVSLEKLIWAF